MVTACSHTSLGHSTAVPPCPGPLCAPVGHCALPGQAIPAPAVPTRGMRPHTWGGRTHDPWGERHLRCSAGHFPAVTTAHAHRKGPCPPGMDSTLETCIPPQLMERRPGRGRAVLQEGGPLGTEASPQTTAVTRPQSAAGPGLEHEAPIGPHGLKASRRQQLHPSWEPKPASREPGEVRGWAHSAPATTVLLTGGHAVTASLPHQRSEVRARSAAQGAAQRTWGGTRAQGPRVKGVGRAEGGRVPLTTRRTRAGPRGPGLPCGSGDSEA